MNNESFVVHCRYLFDIYLDIYADCLYYSSVLLAPLISCGIHRSAVVKQPAVCHRVILNFVVIVNNSDTLVNG